LLTRTEIAPSISSLLLASDSSRYKLLKEMSLHGQV
jgi:hypothetical protein